MCLFINMKIVKYQMMFGQRKNQDNARDPEQEIQDIYHWIFFPAIHVSPGDSEIIF